MGRRIEFFHLIGPAIKLATKATAMFDLFSDEMRRDPYPVYEMLRSGSPVFHLAAFDLWMIFDYDGVKRALVDHDVFSSNLAHVPGNGSPGEWFIFFDPPRHTKLRALIAKAFTPRVVANLEPRIRELSRQLLDETIERGAMDLAVDFAVPLPMRVIAELLGIPATQWPRYKRWSDTILKIANTFAKNDETVKTFEEFRAVKEEMRAFLPKLIAQRRAAGASLTPTPLPQGERGAGSPLAPGGRGVGGEGDHSAHSSLTPTPLPRVERGAMSPLTPTPLPQGERGADSPLAPGGRGVGGEGDTLLTRLVEAEVDGERLTHEEILGFVQLLLVGGQETTANLINNAVLCFLENPDQLVRLRATPDFLPSAIEEVLRYRSPLHWMPRATTRPIELHGQVIPAGKLVLPMIGSANRDPRQFRDAGRFDIARDPNPHLAFGLGIHACLGAPLARLEARIALTDFLERVQDFALASPEPWEPRKALSVHGPSRLPIRFTPGRRVGATV